jgi:hypothetical protein
VRGAALAVAVLAPFLLAATDPSGDVARCRGGDRSADGPIDVVRATGEIVEQGMALRFTVVFAEPIPVPDEEGSPLRVDVVLRDPDVPTVSFRYYRGLNRIVRFDAVPDPLLQIVLLPERGANVFVGAVALGDTLTMTLPGRLITRDADLEGLGLEAIRWNVIARDERACDTIADGRPTLALDEESSPAPTGSPSASPPSPPPPAGGGDPPSWIGWALVGVPIAAMWVYALVLRNRLPRTPRPPDGPGGPFPPPRR